MWEFIQKLFDTSDFPTRWHCGSWSAGHGWLHIVSDMAIFGAYAAIPVVLAYFAFRRKDIPFLPLFWLFAAFILACGTGHLIEATIFWQPWYRLSGTVKLLTAVVSWVTVFALIRVMPHALKLPGLMKLNEKLEGEIRDRERTEQMLRQEREQLEMRVNERTEELVRLNEVLRERVIERERAEKELQQRTSELEEFNQLAVNREERMVELKRQVNELAVAFGKPAVYDLAFVKQDHESPH